MATKRISLNELRSLVKQIVKEEQSKKAVAWLVDEENGLPSIERYDSIEKAKQNIIDVDADHQYKRPMFTSLESLKSYLDRQYQFDYDVSKYMYMK
jgi:hypothetical protein